MNKRFLKYILSRSSTNLLIFISTVSGALVKSGSFGFAEGSACVSGKAKCATCALSEIQFFCVLGGFIFSWVGLCVAK
jgi:hypothetical protein